MTHAHARSDRVLNKAKKTYRLIYTSRFVHVIYSSCVVLIKHGTVTHSEKSWKSSKISSKKVTTTSKILSAKLKTQEILRDFAFFFPFFHFSSFVLDFLHLSFFKFFVSSLFSVIFYFTCFPLIFSLFCLFLFFFLFLFFDLIFRSVHFFIFCFLPFMRFKNIFFLFLFFQSSEQTPIPNKIVEQFLLSK